MPGRILSCELVKPVFMELSRKVFELAPSMAGKARGAGLNQSASLQMITVHLVCRGQGSC